MDEFKMIGMAAAGLIKNENRTLLSSTPELEIETKALQIKKDLRELLSSKFLKLYKLGYLNKSQIFRIYESCCKSDRFMDKDDFRLLAMGKFWDDLNNTKVRKNKIEKVNWKDLLGLFFIQVAQNSGMTISEKVQKKFKKVSKEKKERRFAFKEAADLINDLNVFKTNEDKVRVIYQKWSKHRKVL